MTRKTISLFALFVLFISFQSCDEGSSTSGATALPPFSGKPGELVVVIPNDQWQSPIGDAIIELFQQAYPVIPQYEPRIVVDQQTYEMFHKYYNRARNVLLVNVEQIVDNREVRTIIHNSINAEDQLIFEIIARTEQEFIAELEDNVESIIAKIEAAEIERMRFLRKKHRNIVAENELLETHGVSLHIPKWFKILENKENFVSIIGPSYQGKQAATQEAIIIYHEPYISDSLFNKTEVLLRRDSVLKKNVAGPIDDSYMKTVYIGGYQPQYRELNLDDRYVVEVKGMWDLTRVIKGGPFVSVTLVDESTNRLVTVEAYLHAPGQTKRELIRKLESIIKSVTFPEPELSEYNETEKVEH